MFLKRVGTFEQDMVTRNQGMKQTSKLVRCYRDQIRLEQQAFSLVMRPVAMFVSLSTCTCLQLLDPLLCMPGL